ncbi:hypothetical protein ACQP2E_27330 [Actinoplanes sp. CA-015351]|uniref:hypothetical protein n=1 Tax=Actinoplanes sp. CA-015351 TaxID=3239897 RepID=UPI003D9588E4
MRAPPGARRRPGRADGRARPQARHRGGGVGLRELGSGRPELRRGDRRADLALGGSPGRRRAGGPGAGTGFHDRAADGLRQSKLFTEPELWTFDWEHTYTRDAWRDLVPTSGGHHLLPPGQLQVLLDGLAETLGDTVTVGYTTVVTTASATSR